MIIANPILVINYNCKGIKTKIMEISEGFIINFLAGVAAPKPSQKLLWKKFDKLLNRSYKVFFAKMSWEREKSYNVLVFFFKGFFHQ